MATPKKTAVKKQAVKKTPLSNNKLHAVLGDDLMGNYEERCKSIGSSGMTKSEVARLLAEAFANGTITITAPKVSQKKAIKA